MYSILMASFLSVVTLAIQLSTFMGSYLKVTRFVFPGYLYCVIMGIIDGLFSMMDPRS